MSNLSQTSRKKLERGIIAPAAIMNINGSSMHIDRMYSAEDLYYYTLYWDKITIPTPTMIDMPLPFENELISAKVLDRPSLPFSGGDISIHTHWSFGEIAKQKITQEESDWTIHHLSNEPIYLPEHTLKQNHLKLKITNALPIPSVNGTFSLYDLLEFKIRRSSELEALHTTMDQLLKKINVEEIPAIQKSELIRFENAIKELDRTIFERFKVYKKSDFEVNISVSPDTIKALGTSLIVDGVTGGIPIATIATSISSLFSIEKKYGITFNRYNQGNYNLEYISSARSENIFQK